MVNSFTKKELKIFAAKACYRRIQTIKSEKMKNQEIVQTFLKGFNNPSQIQVSLDLLVDDYKFTNPMVQLNNKSEFIELAGQIGAVVTSIEVLRIIEGENWVSTLYKFTTEIPGLESTIGSEWFKIHDEKIVESYLIYDTSEWRKFYATLNQ